MYRSLVAETLAAYAPTSVASAGATLEREARSPALEMRTWVSRAWTVQATAPSSLSTLPDGCADLIMDLTGAPRAYLATPQSRASTVNIAPAARIAAVRLQPGAAFALFGVPLDELPARADLTALAGAASRELLDRVAMVTTVEAAGQCLDRFLSTRSAGASIDDRVMRAMAAIQSTAGAIPIAELARVVGITTRTLDRLFLRWLGATPKRFARIVRFQRVVTAASTRVPSWSALAASLGFTDQAHLVREVRLLSGGTTPTRLRMNV